MLAVAVSPNTAKRDREAHDGLIQNMRIKTNTRGSLVVAHEGRGGKAAGFLTHGLSPHSHGHWEEVGDKQTTSCVEEGGRERERSRARRGRAERVCGQVGGERKGQSRCL